MDVTVTPWKLDTNSDNDKESFVRTVEFKHAVNVPMAPPYARARKEQRYRRFGQYGMLLETETYVQDVPLANNFYVADRVLVESSDDGKCVVVHAKFDIRFIRRMMFQSIAASQTAKKFVEGFEKMERYWYNAASTTSGSSEACGDVMPVLVEELSSQKQTAETVMTKECDEVLTRLVMQQQQQQECSKPEAATPVSPILLTRMQLTAFAVGLVSFLWAANAQV